MTGASTAGDGDDVIALCAQDPFTHEVPVGDWTLTFHQLDVRGRPITPTDAQGQVVPDPTATATIVKDKTVDLSPPSSWRRGRNAVTASTTIAMGASTWTTMTARAI